MFIILYPNSETYPQRPSSGKKFRILYYCCMNNIINLGSESNNIYDNFGLGLQCYQFSRLLHLPEIGDNIIVKF